MSVYTWSLTAASNATSDAGINWAEGQSPSTVNNSARAMMAAIKAGFNDIAGVSALGGSGDTFTLSLSQSMTSLTNAVVGFFATRTNTGAVTLNVDGLGAKPFRLTSGVALAAGQIVSGSFYQAAYNTSNEEWIIVGHYLVSNSDMATMPAGTVKANITASAAAPSDVTLAAFGAALAPFDSGTVMLFGQTSAPTGWTKVTTHDNKAIRIVSGTVGSGGTVDFTTAFTSKSVAGTVGSTVLDTTQIPAHTHATIPVLINSGGSTYPGLTAENFGYRVVSQTTGNSASTGGGLGHDHTFTGTAIDLAVKYVDFIVATKD